jgi:UDP-glucose:(heptosyl)LPS alpha-1,3-glucosyltransferase
MKLAFIIYKYFEHGGLQRDFMRIAKACQDAGHEINVITTSWSGDIPGGFLIDKIKVSGLTNHAKMESFAKKAKKIATNIKADLVVGFNKMPGLDFYFGGDVCFKTKMDKKKLLLKILPRNRSYLSLERSVFSPKAKTKIFYLTPKQKAEYVESYQTQDERFLFLPAGIERKETSVAEKEDNRLAMRQHLGMPDKETVFLFVGSSFYNKGLDRVIKALGSLSENEFRLFVFGNDKQKKYSTIAKRLGIGNKLSFLGTTSELMKQMVSADILLHPARVEAAGMVLLEAIIAGLPVITTAKCGYSFHVKEAGGMVLSEPFNQEAFNLQLAHLLLDKNARQKMKLNMLEYAKKTDLYNMAEQAVSFIEQRGKI